MQQRRVRGMCRRSRQYVIVTALCCAAMAFSNILPASAILMVTSKTNPQPHRATTPAGPNHPQTPVTGPTNSSQPVAVAQRTSAPRSARSSVRIVLPFAVILIVGLSLLVLLAPYRRKRQTAGEVPAESVERDTGSGRIILR